MAATAEAPSIRWNVLVSARLASTFSWDPVDNTALSWNYRRLTVAVKSFAAGDITINGQELAAFDGTSIEDIYDLIANINANVDNVSARSIRGHGEDRRYRYRPRE